jgi:hypothetical protein
MSDNHARDPGKEQLWGQRIAQWKASGLSVRAFCQRHRLREPSFYAWRRTLEQRQAKPAFLPVQVGAEEVGAGAALELLLPGGRTVRVPAGFDAAALRRLLAVLEGRPC